MRKKDIFEENKELQSSLFLAQSYQDAWADYGRSLKKERFFYFFGAMAATFKVGKMDYVFSISQPPILGGLLGVWGKWVKHCSYDNAGGCIIDCKSIFRLGYTGDGIKSSDIGSADDS